VRLANPQPSDVMAESAAYLKVDEVVVSDQGDPRIKLMRGDPKYRRFKAETEFNVLQDVFGKAPSETIRQIYEVLLSKSGGKALVWGSSLGFFLAFHQWQVLLVEKRIDEAWTAAQAVNFLGEMISAERGALFPVWGVTGESSLDRFLGVMGPFQMILAAGRDVPSPSYFKTLIQLT